MNKYGFINEDGSLRAIDIKGFSETQLQTILESGWKPIDDIDFSEMECEDNYIVIAEPYDNGDRISIRYKKVLDVDGIKSKILSLKEMLASSDYKVIKCYEASVIGEPIPYDAQLLHIERESIRVEINNLEGIIEKNDEK